MKKILSIVIALMLILSTLSGCESRKQTNSNQSDDKKAAENLNLTGFPIVNNKITLKIMGPKASIQAPWDQMDVFKEMEKKTNIHFEFDTPPAESYQEKKNLAFASGQLPDIFFARDSINPDDEATYGSQGTLVPIEDLIKKYAPDIENIFNKFPNIRKSITCADNHIYSLPSGTDLPMNLTVKMWINQEWLNNVGLKMPSNVDELYNVLKAFKEDDPNKNGKSDEIPMSSVKLDDIRSGILSAFGFVDSREAVKNGKVIFVPIEQGYKEYLTYMNKLYKEGLLDNETFSQTSQQMTAKGNQGRVGLFANAGPFLTVKAEDNDKYPALPPLTSSVNSQKMWPKNPEATVTAFAITNKNKYPEASIRWVDYLYTEEGSILFHNGIEGKHWKWVDVNGERQWERITPEGKANPEEWRATATPNCGTGTPEIWSKDFAEKQKDPLNAFIRKEVAEKYEPSFKEIFPQIRFKPDEQKQLTALETDLNTYVAQMEGKFISGNIPMSEWDEYVKNIKKMNLDKVLSIYQTGYDRWNSVK